MAKAKEEKKQILERAYTIPLRQEFLKVPRYKRAKKAAKAVKEFLAKHMKVENRDLEKVKMDPWLNRAIWMRGIKKPVYKVTVKAIKYSDGTVRAEIVGLPPKYRDDEKKLLKRKAKVEARTKEHEEKRKKELEKKKAEDEKKKTEEKAKLEEEAKKEKTEEEKEEDKKKKEEEKTLHKAPKAEFGHSYAKEYAKSGEMKRGVAEIHRKALER